MTPSTRYTTGVNATRKPPAVPTSDGLRIHPRPKTPEGTAAVDHMPAVLGLTHDDRSSRTNTLAGGERRLQGAQREKASRADAAPAPAVDILRSRIFAQADGLTHGFSTRGGGVSTVYRPWLPDGLGDLNLGFTVQDDAEHVRENRRRFFTALGVPAMERFALLRQEHTSLVHVLERDAALPTDFTAPGKLRGDAVMTDRPGTLLAIGTADCLPVLLFDPVRRVVAAFHAGWRGTLGRIVERGVGTMRRRYGSAPEDILAAIGPGIGPVSYAVSEELRQNFESQFRYAPRLFTEVYDSDPLREKSPPQFPTERAPGHSPTGPQLHLNLPQANRQQLLDAGVLAEHVAVLDEDTAAQTGRFFSHRAENGFTGRMLSVIGLTA